MNNEEWIEAALPNYKATNPILLEEIKDLSEKDQQDQIRWAFEDEADAQGKEVWELALALSGKSPEEQKQLWLAAHKEAAQALEMDWDEYVAENAIVE